MRRRNFIALLGGAAATWPLAARAQQAGRLPTIGYLGSGALATDSQRMAAFVQRLRELGWIEGRTVVIDYRWAEGRSERVADIAAEFVQDKVDLIFATGTEAALAAKKATALIPIVFPVAGDPLGSGKVRNPLALRTRSIAVHSWIGWMETVARSSDRALDEQISDW